VIAGHLAKKMSLRRHWAKMMRQLVFRGVVIREVDLKMIG